MVIYFYICPPDNRRGLTYHQGGAELSYLFSILMGILQGVTEFLPVSSSGHLTLFQYFFGQNPEETDMLFTILLHFGTLFSVCVYYWKDVLGMIREFFLGVAALFSKEGTAGRPPEARRLVLMVIVATLPLFAVLLVNAFVPLFDRRLTHLFGKGGALRAKE